ncbi:aldehyde dehydrogenase family protein [Algimonas porphyrae]|uniref:Aldehyde dehydrogenase n=1 Tax=Algimonas porphyrae TaxID=1128113 RepID=A0ABQ5UWM8_9PROT|nr:aldehyde dehydrogenase family protein [Algimonas porphyrae]GLQ19591.1 aldehyde dehydrogenase [Algimonas porphyrae]
MSMSRTLSVINPRTGETDYKITAVDAQGVAKVADRLRAAQPDWRAQGIDARGDALRSLADALDDGAKSVMDALEIDTGRRRLAQSEVQGVIGMLRGWAALAPTLLPEPDWVQGRAKPNFKHQTDYVPYQLTGVISPWNFPITLSFIDAVQALMAGSCVLIKPSEVTPRFADALLPIIAQAGLSDIIAFVQGDGATGAALIPNVDCVCFTGSVATGRKVALAAAENLIPANLELGGKDPLIITPSADMDRATSLALRASVLATGQACQSIERVYVPTNDYESFVKQISDKAHDISFNYPDISFGDIGPFIFYKQAAIASAQIEDAKSKGATVLSGGVVERHGGGYWMAPTVIRDVTHDMDIMREETFGPVIPVMAYDTIKDAIALANDTAFGLSGAVFAGSIEEAHTIGRQIDAGAISLMDGALTGQYFEAPKQSFKASGLGGSRMGADGFRRFFRQKAYIANTTCPLTIKDFSEDG